MLTKKEGKDIQSLRHKKFRDETGLFVAEGPKIVWELLQAIPECFVKVFALDSWIEKNKPLLSQVICEKVTEAELERLSQLQTPNEVVAVLRKLKTIEPAAKENFSIYLDAIQDPGNLGTIIRIADWFGIANIICGEGCADLYNTKVIQSTMASIARVNVFYDSEMNWLTAQTVPIYAAVLGGQSIYEMSSSPNGILIIGNESKGIQPSVLEKATQKITIPRKGEAESLNAAVATGIILSYLMK